MKKVYIVCGYGITPNKVFTNKESAEKEAEKINYNLSCSGSYGSVSVREVELVED